MRAQDIFDICHARYRGMRGWLSGRISAVDLEVPATRGGYHWRPERARAAEYVADFELAGQRALRHESWKGRRRLFAIYFCRGVEYRRAIVLLGVSPGTFDWWTQQVKQAVGRELDRAGLFPPWKYFHVRTHE